MENSDTKKNYHSMCKYIKVSIYVFVDIHIDTSPWAHVSQVF